jgi:hypothetical protein
MKTKIIIFLSLFFTVSLLAQQQGKYYFTKSGHIEYTLGGNTTGTKSVWFDNYGMLMYTLTESTTTVKIMGFSNKTSEKKLEIRKGNQIWLANLLDNTGSQMSIEAQTEIGKEITSGQSDAQLHAKERKIITDIGGEIEGYENFLGRNCLKFTLGSNKFLQFKGIPLKSFTTLIGITYTETATSFDTNAAVPATKFELPKNIKFQQMGEALDALPNETN